jgi:hypothetical protein
MYPLITVVISFSQEGAVWRYTPLYVRYAQHSSTHRYRMHRLLSTTHYRPSKLYSNACLFVCFVYYTLSNLTA